MNDPAHDLMTALADGAAVDEASAANLAALAVIARDQGVVGAAATFEIQARSHRVKAVELRARLGALVERYGERHLDRREP